MFEKTRSKLVLLVALALLVIVTAFLVSAIQTETDVAISTSSPAPSAEAQGHSQTSNDADSSIDVAAPRQHHQPAMALGTGTVENGAGLRDILERIAQADRLPAEGRLFVGDDLSLTAMESLLESSDFADQLAQFELDMLGDPLADEIASHYRDEIRRQLVESGAGSELVNFACGLRACVGALRAAEDTWDFAGWQREFGRDERTQHYALASMEYPNGNGSLELRFVFTTDPSSNAINAPLFPRPGG